MDKNEKLGDRMVFWFLLSFYSNINAGFKYLFMEGFRSE